MIIDQFNALTPAELITLEQHLKLGMAHLKNHLSENEIKELLKPHLLDSDKMREIGQNDMEISGNLSLILNTIFTATFGAWMGYSAFWKIDTNSLFAFGSVVSLATILGAFIGYQNVQFTKKQSKDAIQNQKLLLLQIEILKKIEMKRREEVLNITQELNHLFLNLSRGTSVENKISILGLAGKSKIEISEWIEKVETVGKEKLVENSDPIIKKAFTTEWVEVHAELKRNFISSFSKKEDLDVIHNEEQKGGKALDSSLHKLIYTSPKKAVKTPSWIRSNAQSLILGLAPTLLGGFSSISVYLGGIPLILKNFGFIEAFQFLTNPLVKEVQFILSVLLTLYFGFSFVFSNRKAFKRYREQEKIRQQIIQRESTLTLLDAQLLKLKELRKTSSVLMKLFKIADKVVSLKK